MIVPHHWAELVERPLALLRPRKAQPRAATRSRLSMALTRSAIKRHKQGDGADAYHRHQHPHASVRPRRRHRGQPSMLLPLLASNKPCPSSWQVSHWRDLHDPATGRLKACRPPGAPAGTFPHTPWWHCESRGCWNRGLVVQRAGCARWLELNCHLRTQRLVCGVPRTPSATPPPPLRLPTRLSPGGALARVRPLLPLRRLEL